MLHHWPHRCRPRHSRLGTRHYFTHAESVSVSEASLRKVVSSGFDFLRKIWSYIYLLLVLWTHYKSHPKVLNSPKLLQSLSCLHALWALHTRVYIPYTATHTGAHFPSWFLTQVSQEVACFLGVQLLTDDKWLLTNTFPVLCPTTLVSSRWTPAQTSATMGQETTRSQYFFYQLSFPSPSSQITLLKFTLPTMKW